MGSTGEVSSMEMGGEGSSPQRPVIVLVPFPAQGHVTPMLHLAAALLRHGFRAVVVLPDSIHRRLPAADRGRTVTAGEDDGGGGGREQVRFARVADGLAEDNRGDLPSLERAMEEVMPAPFEGLLRSLGCSRPSGRGRVACVVVDLLASWAMGVAARCMVPVAGFWPAMLATYRLVAAAPEMVRRRLISASGIPMGEPASISDALHHCCGPKLSTEDLPWLVGDLAARRARFAFWRRTLDRSRALRWLLVNTFSGEEQCHRGELDAASHDHGRTASPAGPRILHVRPLEAVAEGDVGGGSLSFWEEDGSCMEWLDARRPGSVVYVSFGSWVGPIGDGSVAELALGLEATQRPFLWVLGDSWRCGLPEGYPDRVAGRGKVVAWAPQRDVLRHPSVGCFLTHCGWNSTMEAVECRKRLLCCPVAGDQPVNCEYIVQVWGVGVRLEGMRGAAVAEGVEKVMGAEGEELQRRVAEMGEEIYGEEGKARAAAELLAFAEDLKAAAGESPQLPHMSYL